MNLQMLKALARVFNSDDGKELIIYLEELSKSNYKSIKYCDPNLREIYVGRAQAIDEIKDFIINAENDCIEKTKTDSSDWSL